MSKTFGIGVFSLIFSTAIFAQHYTQTNLVSNGGNGASATDTNLVNPWGLSAGPGGPRWVSDNGTGLSTLYDGSGNVQGLVVSIPSVSGKGTTGSPSGIVFNGSPTDFLLSKGNPAFFIFVTEDGSISAWNPKVTLTSAVLVRNNSCEKAVYKGVTIGEVDGKKYLYVTNFRSGRVEIYDSNFNRVSLAGNFSDDKLPSDFSPFNIQSIGSNLYVTFAKQDTAKHDDLPGPGLGYVDVFSTSGVLLQRLQHGNWLNAPWGLALAPGYFGEFSHSILVGNFGGGTIAAYNPVTGQFLGNMLAPNGSVLNINGLWGVSFGNDGKAGLATTLYFTAGPDNESNGLFGTLTPVASELSENDEE